MSVSCIDEVRGNSASDMEHFMRWLEVHECNRLYCEVAQEPDGNSRAVWIRASEPYVTVDTVVTRLRPRRDDAFTKRLIRETRSCELRRPCRIVLYKGAINIYK